MGNKCAVLACSYLGIGAGLKLMLFRLIKQEDNNGKKP